MKEQVEKLIIEQMVEMTENQNVFAADVLTNLDRLMLQELPF